MRILLLILIYMGLVGPVFAKDACLPRILSILSGRSIFDTFATEISQTTGNKALVQDAIMEVLNERYIKAVQSDYYSSDIYRAYLEFHSESIQNNISSLRNLGFKPKENIFVPVKKYSDLTIFDRRWQYPIVHSFAGYMGGGKEIAVALSKRGITISPSKIETIAHNSLNIDGEGLKKIYAELASTTFSDSHWKANTLNTLKLDDLTNSSWKVTNVSPFNEGFFNQTSAFDAAGIRNVDQTIPEIKILSSTESDGKLNIQRNNWGHKLEGEIDKRVTYEAINDKPYLKFYIPLYRKGGGLLPLDQSIAQKFSNKLEQTRFEKGLFQTYDQHIQFRCAPQADKTSLLCIGKLHSSFQGDAPEFITAFHEKNVFMMTLKRVP